MGRYIAVVICVLMVLSLCGCGGSSSASAEQKIDPSKPDFHSWFNEPETTLPESEVTVPETQTAPTEPAFLWMEVTGDNLNVRTGPGMDYAVQWRFQSGDVVKVHELSQGWGRTDWGWISLDYVKDCQAPDNGAQSEPEEPDYYGSVITALLSDKEDTGYGLSYMYHHYQDLEGIGYALLDLDGDGQEELLLGGRNDDFPFDCLTVKNGRTVNVFSSGERYPFYVFRDGYIKNYWSNGAANSGVDYYRYKNGALSLEFGWAYDADYALEHGYVGSEEEVGSDNCCFLYTERKDGVMHDAQPITMDELNAICESYEESLVPLELSYRPLAEYF